MKYSITSSSFTMRFTLIVRAISRNSMEMQKPDRAMAGHFLTLREITKRFGGREVVERLSLEAAKGEIVALTGPSGCGKTTLLRLIAGLETPEQGEIWIAGEQVASPGRNLVPARRRGIGFVFQDLALWPHL